jgi:ribonuclease D
VPEVLATRRDLQQLLSGDTDVPPLKGWRREVVGEALLSQL